MLKYFELRVMLTQQENLYYQVNSGRPKTFVNKLADTFQNLGFLLEILSFLAHDYKRINSEGLKTLSIGESPSKYPFLKYNGSEAPKGNL